MEKNVLRLEVAVDHILVLHELEGFEHLFGVVTDEGHGEAFEVVHLDEFVHVYGEEVEDDAQVFSEHKVILNLDNCILILWILSLQML